MFSKYANAPTSDDQSDLLCSHPSTWSHELGGSWPNSIVLDLRYSSKPSLESLSSKSLTVLAGVLSKIDY